MSLRVVLHRGRNNIGGYHCFACLRVIGFFFVNLQHWRGFQGINAPKAAPMLEFGNL